MAHPNADEDYAFGLYPDGSGVLRNKLGLRDAEALQRAEYQVTADRTRDAPAFPPTRAGYQALHRHLLGEMFEWAGELRTVDFGKGGTRFASARFLDANLDKLFADLAAERHLKGLPAERFAERAGHFISELNAIHPFREGNGRAMRLFLAQLAEAAGHRLDVTRMPGPAWIEASIQGFAGDERPLARLVAGAIELPRLLAPAVAAVEAREAIEAARREIQDRTRAIHREPSGFGATPPKRRREELQELREELERLADPARALAPLATLQGRGVAAIPVLAPADASPRERVHAILEGAARTLAQAVAAAPPSPTAAVNSPAYPGQRAGPKAGLVASILDAAGPPAPAPPTPGPDQAPSFAERLAAYKRRQVELRDAEAGAPGQGRPEDEPDPGPARARPSKGPSPS